MSDSLSALEARIGYTFRDRAHLILAVTHPSCQQEANSTKENNQRLEFLGDAVLHAIVAEALYREFPTEREGVLTRRRASLANGTFLANLAREIQLDAALRLGASEEATGGRNRDSALEDAFEALIGAVFIDGGLDAARQVALGIYGTLATRLEGVETVANPKGRLQEIVQPIHGNAALRYEVKAAGADHSKEFEAVVYLFETALGSGRGPSKKLAEEAAAAVALAKVATR